MTLFSYFSSCLLQLQPVVLVLASVTIFIFLSVLSSCVWSNDCSSVYQNKLHYYQPLAFRCHTHIYIYTHTYIYIYIYYIISYIYQLSNNEKWILTQDGRLNIIHHYQNWKYINKKNCHRQVVPKSKNVVVALPEIIVTSKIPVDFNK